MGISHVILFCVAFFAAIVNGAIGFGLSSITAPVALNFFVPRLLNPVLILNEVAANLSVLWMNRGSFVRVRGRVILISLCLIPGICLGSLLLSRIDQVIVKGCTYSILLVLLVIKMTGKLGMIDIRKRAHAGVSGILIGLVYSLTTVSGPLLSYVFGRDPEKNGHFKCSVSFVRTFESFGSLVMYFFLGLITKESLWLAVLLLPFVALGLHIGHRISDKVDVITFQLLILKLDLVLITFGATSVLAQMNIVSTPTIYLATASATLFALSGVGSGRFAERVRLLVRTHEELPRPEPMAGNYAN